MFSTTMASIVINSESKNAVDVDVYWAGDSRCYCLSADGLQQLSDDHENDAGMTNLFCIVGRSGSGKDSIVDSFCEKHPEYKDTKLLSFTTRPKRSESENTHTFITNAEYEHIKNSSEDSIFAETSINDYVYFATQNQLKKCFKEIDVNGDGELSFDEFSKLKGAQK